MNIIVAGVHLFLGFALLLALAKLYRSFATPSSVMVILWCTGLFFAQADIVHYDAIPGTFVLLYYMCLVLFIGGGCLTLPFLRRNDSAKISGYAEYNQVQTLIAAVATGSLGVLGGIMYYRYINSIFGIESLVTDPGKIRYEEAYGFLRKVNDGLPRFAILRVLLVPSVIPMAAYLQIPRARGKIPLALLGTMVTFLLMLNTGRTALFSAAVMAIATVIYVRQAWNLPRVPGARRVMYALILVSASLLYFTLTNALLGKDSKDFIVKSISVLPDSLQWAISPIHYFSSSFVAFPKMVQNESFYSDNGLLTFGFAGTILNKLAPLSVKYPEYVQPFCEVPLPTNIYTYLDAPFLDFGYGGLVVATLCYGFISHAAYTAWCRRQSLLRLYLLGIVTYCCASSIMVNRFGNFETCMWITAGTIFIYGSSFAARYYIHAIKRRHR
jgi:oligosaccharide repeat unit polymerase